MTAVVAPGRLDPRPGDRRRGRPAADGVPARAAPPLPALSDPTLLARRGALLAAPSPRSPPRRPRAAARALLAKPPTLYGDGAAHAAGFTQIYTPAGLRDRPARVGHGLDPGAAAPALRLRGARQEGLHLRRRRGPLLLARRQAAHVHKLSPEERARLPIVFLSEPDELAARVRRSPSSRRVRGAVLAQAARAAPRARLAEARRSRADGIVREPRLRGRRRATAPSSASRAGAGRRRGPAPTTGSPAQGHADRRTDRRSTEPSVLLQ